MKRSEEDSIIFFSEFATYEEGNENQKELAYQYLKSWKKMLLGKIIHELPNYEPSPDDGNEQWVERPSYSLGPVFQNATIGLKFWIKNKLPYQIN